MAVPDAEEFTEPLWATLREALAPLPPLWQAQTLVQFVRVAEMVVEMWQRGVSRYDPGADEPEPGAGC
jgi:hypothetical protein